MVDHQKTLYEVMKRGVDSDQKLNHAYATGLLKKKLRIFCNDYSFFFKYHVEQKNLNGNQCIERFSHCSKNLTICTQKITANFDFYKYFISVAFDLYLDVHF